MKSKNFCYWQEDSPVNNNFFNHLGKICLFRLNEYKIEKEAGIESKISIFCPYINAEQASECLEYKVSKYPNE